MHGRPGRRVVAAFLATALGLAIGVSPVAVRTAAAAGPLRVEADASYALDPGDGRVEVRIDVELTNEKPNSGSTIFFYSNYLMAIQPEAVGLRVSDASGPLTATTTERRFFTRLDVQLRSNLFFGETTRFTVRYDLVGAAPRSEHPIRVGRAFATFGVWAWGDRGLGTVAVAIPDAYEEAVEGSFMTVDRAGAGHTLRATPDVPDRFFALVSADNQGAYSFDRVSLEGDIELVVRGWPEDTRWQRSVTNTLRTGMPELVELIGLPWPVTGDLEIRQRYTPALEGYAGVFLADGERIDVTEDLDPLTVMHEASHAWFNNLLFDDRWVAEGLAEEYSWRVQRTVGGPAGFGALAPAPDHPGKVALDAWTFPEVIRDEETDRREAYGYQASFWVVHQIVESVGVGHMRTVFEFAQNDWTAYAAGPSAERVERIDDWRRFLDLAQPIDGQDSAEIEALVRELVLAPGEAVMLDRRRASRDQYRALLAAGEGWAPPWFVRRELGVWRFDTAKAAMDEALTLLGQRGEVDAAASALGLTPYHALRRAYESASESFDFARRIAEDELEALDAIEAAKAQVEGPLDLVAQVGLIGSELPAASYERARGAYELGDLDAAVASAGAATALLASAVALGQQRLLIGAIVAAGLLLLLAVALFVRRRRRRAPVLAATLAADPAAAQPPVPQPPALEGGLAPGDPPVDP